MSVPAGLALARLLQLASPALPVGAYSYSQGLEAAVEAGTIVDSQSAGRWIGDALLLSLAKFEAPAMSRMHAAWLARDYAAVRRLDEWFRSTRETAELRAETLQMGYSLRRLLVDLDTFDAMPRAELERSQTPTFPAVFTFATAHWEIPIHDALIAYLWSWLENQVMAALKAVPLGQTDGQRLLMRLGGSLGAIADQAVAAEEAAFTNFSPGLAIASSRHESQYSRLFRS
ncbi:MAG: urease accessory protein UreF [Betaproteobacteria bacterium]|nr:urease accessory protein UreF [Betaproteobacteria bacterium]